MRALAYAPMPESYGPVRLSADRQPRIGFVAEFRRQFIGEF